MKINSVQYINNKKLHYNYHIIDTYNAGIVLKGSEVKSIRDRRINISEAYCQFTGKELFVKNCHITSTNISSFGHDEFRERKLLLKKKELKQIKNFVKDKGNTIAIESVIIPKAGFIKFKIALCKGKHNYDKRNDIKKRDLDREMQ